MAETKTKTRDEIQEEITLEQDKLKAHRDRVLILSDDEQEYILRKIMDLLKEREGLNAE